MSDTTKLFGHCYCGAITFEASGQSVKVGHCHCDSCRRHSGAAMLSYAGYRPDQVLFTALQPTKFTTKDSVTRGFCSRCGSSVCYEGNQSEYIFIYLGLFDEPEKLVPQVHMMYSEKIEWLKVDDNLPKSDELLQRSESAFPIGDAETSVPGCRNRPEADPRQLIENALHDQKSYNSTVRRLPIFASSFPRRENRH